MGGPVPDDLLRGWAELTSILATEAPTGDLELEPGGRQHRAVREREATTARQGRTKYNTVALDAHGVVVACTDLATTVHEPGRAYQRGALTCAASTAATGSASRSRSPTCGCSSASAPTSPG